MGEVHWRRANGTTGEYVGPVQELGHGIPRRDTGPGIRRALFDLAFGYVSGFPVRDILAYVFPGSFREAPVLEAIAEDAHPHTATGKPPVAGIRVAEDLTIPCQWGIDCPNVATRWRLSTASPMPKRMAVLNETTGAWCYPVCESHQVPMDAPSPAIAAGIDRWAAYLREVLRKSLGIAPPRDPWNEEA